MVGDLLVARPIGLVMAAGGTAAWIVSLPFTLLAGHAGEAAEALMVGPLETTFLRCLGCAFLGDILRRDDAPSARQGAGTIHHVAFRATDDAHQMEIREALLAAGQQVTPQIDRQYFNAIYFREPGGVLFEVATDPPGFAVDEAPEALGSTL
jgi:catechol 2,3-dioxygenase-like lactoylglutathione lyase family enzyme